jgi:hypothetical protein
MSHAFAFAMLLIHQRQAHDLRQQQQMHQLFVTFVSGELTAEQYEHGLDLARGIRRER